MDQPFRITVVFEGRMIGFVKEIDSDGLFITTPRTFRRGEPVEIGLFAPGMPHALPITVVVTDIKPGDGVGCGYLNLNSRTLASVNALINKVHQAGSRTDSAIGKKSILIVEDSTSIRTVYKSRLLLDGYDITDVGTAMEAMKLLQQGSRPDLILLDIVMPVMDGFKLLNVIRRTPSMEKLPVIILSAKGSAPEIERAMELGISGYLIKTTTSPVKLSQEIRAFFQR